MMNFLPTNLQDFRFLINLSIPQSIPRNLSEVNLNFSFLNNPYEIYQMDGGIWVLENKAEPVVESAGRADLQTQEYENLIDNEKEMINQISVVNVDFPGWSVAKQQLQEIREKVEEAHALDSEIDLVPDSAYENANQVLDKLLVWAVSMPADIGWLIDGGIGFEWWSRDGKGIGTISIYGDNKVVYGASGEVSSGSIETKGTCPLSNFASLNDFRTKLLSLCSQ